MARKPARLQLLDEVTGAPIEEVDVRTRTDLIEHGSVMLDQKLNTIDQEIASIKNAYAGPKVSIIDADDIYLESGSGDYTVTFIFYKGRDNVTSIKIYNKGSVVYTCTSGDISLINSTGTLSLNYSLSNNISIHEVYAVVDDGESQVKSETLKVTYTYPIYYGVASNNTFNPSIITSGTKVIGNDISTKFNASNQIVFFASPYEPSSVKDQNGINILDALYTNDVVVNALDGLDVVYHVYYTNKITISSYKLSFSL